RSPNSSQGAAIDGSRVRRSIAVRRSALRELGSAAGLAEADLLAFDLARIARHIAGVAQRLAQCFVVLDQRTGQAMANRAGLAGDAAALDRDVDVEITVQAHGLERLAHDHTRRLAAEELVERTLVDADVAAALAQEHAGGRGLAAARAVVRRNRHTF